MSEKFMVTEGLPYPLGASFVGNGVNFALFSANAEKVELCIFDELGRKEIARIEVPGYTDQVWHVYVEGLRAGARYGYRVYGPYDPLRGHRFNPHKLLLDPYAKKIDGIFHWQPTVFAYEADNPQQDLVMDKRDNASVMPKCVVVDSYLQTSLYPPLTKKPNIPWNKTILYETHLKGFTQLNLAVPANLRGTFAALAQPAVLEYIKNLGVTAIELLPIHGFIDENFLVNQGLSNYWGYNSLHFFAPHSSYLSSGNHLEFKQMVDAAHDVGLEIILDVVYNHTAEGNHLGPSLSFRGIDNASYYALQSHDPRFYVNDTGCGNTFNLKHPRVLQLVMDSLRYWAGEMGVDGFRFDLATVLGRESYGFDPGSGFFDAIRQDPVLAQCKLIAEPWDIGPGGYQLGNYPTGWGEWNDRYRDTCRRYWHGELGMLPEFARRIHGSSDLFERNGRAPSASINFITSHDGFCLEDLVSYNSRANLANKEQNRDGHHANFSFNHGVEGPTDDPEVLELRMRQKRNYFATLFLSQGTPMILAGDEVGRTQKGNNNAYCQDNDINWIDWQNITPANQNLQLFVHYLISLRQQYPLLTSPRYIHQPDQPEPHERAHCQVRWLNESGEEMRDKQWTEQFVQTLGWVLEKIPVGGHELPDKQRLLILFNADEKDKEFRLLEDELVKEWHCLLDTRFEDGMPETKVILASEGSVKLKSRSLIFLSASFA